MNSRQRNGGNENSEDSDQPWDCSDANEPVYSPAISPMASGKKKMKRVRYEDEADFEDGDLPPLSLSTGNVSHGERNSGGRVVNGERTRMRPLSPPSHMGLSSVPSSEQTKESAFWNQLDPPSTDERDYLDSDEGPDDEVAARRAESRARQIALERARKSRERKAVQYERKSNGYDDTSEYEEDIEDDDDQADFCTYTLKTVETICGENICGGDEEAQKPLPHSAPSVSVVSTQRSRSVSRSRASADAVDEHTAIEVEYVEPEDHSEKADEMSTSRKNAFLAAMARKAKKDFESSATGSGHDGTAGGDASADDVYKGFSASEKRKFLRLINSGLSPRESSDRIKAERDEQAAQKATKKSSRFRFWKKGSKSKDTNVDEKPDPPKDDEAMENSEPGEEKKEEGERELRTNEANVPEASQSASTEEEERGMHESADIQRQALLGQRKTTADEQIVESSSSPPVSLKPFVASEDTEEEADLSGRFAKSGINYYDAVRRDQSESDDDDDREYEAPASPSKSRGRKLKLSLPRISPKAQGFTDLGKFEEPEEEIVEATRDNEKKREANTGDNNEEFRHGDDILADLEDLRGRGVVGKSSQTANDSSSLKMTPQKLSPSTASAARSLGIGTFDESAGTVFSGETSQTEQSRSRINAQEAQELVKIEKELLRPVDMSLGQSKPENSPWSPVQGKTSVSHSDVRSQTENSPRSPVQGKTLVSHSDVRSQTENSPWSSVQGKTLVSHSDVRSQTENSPRSPVQGKTLVSHGDVRSLTEHSPRSPVKGKTSVSHGDVRSQVSQHDEEVPNSPSEEIDLDDPKFNQVKSSSNEVDLDDHTFNQVNSSPNADVDDHIFNQVNSSSREMEADDHRFEQSRSESRETAVHGQTTLDVKPIIPISAATAIAARSLQSSDDVQREARSFVKPADIAEHVEAEETRSKSDNKVHDDLDMQEYLDSTDQYSTSALAQEHASVMTSESHSGPMSVYTQASTLTQSSRKRRPGAAKNRLAKAKEANRDTRKTGWHESIRAVAASNNRVWKPKVGWVDYEETPTDHVEPPSAEKIHIPLDVTRGSRGNTSVDSVSADISSAKAESVVVPFPSEWEQQREDMMHQSAKPTSPRRSRKAASPTRMKRVTSSPTKPSGWVASMKQATSKLKPYGKIWDPETGWISTGEGEDDNASSRRSVEQGSVNDDYMMRLHAEQNSTASPVPGPPPEQKIYVRGSDEGVSQHPGTDRYMQLGETGSIKSAMLGYTSDKPVGTKRGIGTHMLRSDLFGATNASSQNKTYEKQNDEVPLLAPTNEFHEVGVTTAPTVDVVKERVDAEDMDWFPAARRGSYAKKGPAMPTSESPVKETRGIPLGTGFQATVSSKSPRLDSASAGVTNTNTHDENLQEENEGLVWEGVVFEADSFLQGSVNSAKLVDVSRQTQDTPKSNSSGASISSLPSKTVPKLVKNKKDTSEISAKKNDRSAPPSQSVRFLDPSSPKEMHTEETVSGDSPSTAASPIGVKLMAQKFESARREPSPESASQKEFSGNTFDHSKRRSHGETGESDFGSNRNISPQINQAHPRSLDDLDVSPIKPGVEEVDSDIITGNEQQKSIFKRMVGCGAPILNPANKGQETDAMPMAHLAFLRKNPPGGAAPGASSSRFIPPYLCGRPDVIVEEDGEGEERESSPEEQPIEEKVITPQKPQPIVNASAATSSVISEDFGAKTAYLEALAMRTAVSKPRKGDSKRKIRSSASDVSTASSNTSHKEKWKAFLERKSAAGVSPGKSRPGSSSEVSKNAEKYAAEKVEEIMAMMASRSKSTPRSWRTEGGPNERTQVARNYQTTPRASASPYGVVDVMSQQQRASNSNVANKKSDSYRAAEDLAAARVEAMMAALSSNTLDEAEI